MLCASHWQTVEAEVPDHLWNRFEGSTELAEDVLARVILLLNSHVHEALGTPGGGNEIELVRLSCWVGFCRIEIAVNS
jgi:hypothetical protein